MRDGEFSIESAADSLQTIQFLEDKIYEHNSARIGRYDGSVFCKIVRDENKNIIAGIGGWSWAHIGEITQLWVAEAARRRGLGKMLLISAEADAKSKGCNTILVRSFGFQAPDFYVKMGYKADYVLTNFPGEHSYYLLLKRLEEI